MRSFEEISRAIELLKKQKEVLPEMSIFGDPNHEIIDGQIRVLNDEFSFLTEIYDMFGLMEESAIFAIVEAFDWLNGEDNDFLEDLEYGAN